jgi:site-specific DNA-methyltransferase (adenine-specific)
MIPEASTAGFYHSDGCNKDFPKLQILTIEELLNGKEVEMPPTQSHSKKLKNYFSKIQN